MRAPCRVDHSEWQHHQLMTQSVIPICRYRAARAAEKMIMLKYNDNDTIYN